MVSDDLNGIGMTTMIPHHPSLTRRAFHGCLFPWDESHG